MLPCIPFPCLRLKHKINTGVKSAGGQVAAWFENDPGDLSGETSDKTTVNVTLTQVRSRPAARHTRSIALAAAYVLVARTASSMLFSAFIPRRACKPAINRKTLNVVSAFGQTLTGSSK